MGKEYLPYQRVFHISPDRTVLSNRSQWLLFILHDTLDTTIQSHSQGAGDFSPRYKYPGFAQGSKFHLDNARDSEKIVKPFMQVMNYMTMNFATLE